ncbi:hypothetical protein ACFL35_20435, partial [Candidatus Riflebacteria bacterium]
PVFLISNRWKSDKFNMKKPFLVLLLLFYLHPPIIAKIYTGSKELKILVDKINDLNGQVKELSSELSYLKKFLSHDKSKYFEKNFNGSGDGIFNHLNDFGGWYVLKSVDGNPFFGPGKLSINSQQFILLMERWDGDSTKDEGKVSIMGTSSMKFQSIKNRKVIKEFQMQNMFFRNSKDLYYTDKEGKQFHWVRIKKKSNFEKVEVF